MTRGEYRVGISFNPSQDTDVAVIKVKAAELIDLIDALRPDVETSQSKQLIREVTRLKCLAQTSVEEAAMWAVKAATKPTPEVEYE